MNPIAFNTTPHALPLRSDAPVGPHPARPGDTQRSPARAADHADFSSNVRLSTDESDAPVRLDLVRRVREQLSAGSYETPDKVAIAAHLAAQDLDILA